MRRVIFNLKGGVGKTSIACNLASCLADRGRKVLVIDLDSQGNTTEYLLGRTPKADEVTVANFFETALSFGLFKTSLHDAIYPTEIPGLSLVPASNSLSELQSKLESKYKIYKLSKALDLVCGNKKFDEVIIDTPPALNFYSVSALIAAQRVLVPFDCDQFSLQGLNRVVEIVDEIREDHNSKLILEGAVINQYQSRAGLPQAMISAVEDIGVPICEPYLMSSVIMKESHLAHQPLIYSHPRHKLADQYRRLADRLTRDNG